MNEKIFCLLFSLIFIFLFSLCFNDAYMDRIYEKIKHQKSIWYWFQVFKIPESKANFIKMLRGISIFVIAIQVIMITVIVLRY
jgi:hypothetical protein